MFAYKGDWPARRARFLSSHPSCVDCGAAAAVPDHTPPRRLLVLLGINDPDHDRWLAPRCESCHNTKTQTVDRPILDRWRAGEDAQLLADESMRLEQARRGGVQPPTS